MMVFKQIFVIIAAVYIVILLFVYLRQESFIFFPTPASHPAPNDTGITEYSFSHEGEELNGWLVNTTNSDNSILVYYGGNAEDIVFSFAEFKGYENTASLLMNYRGYGSSSGKPGERELFADALAIFDDVKMSFSPQKIYLMGRSLGSGVAAYVAANREVDRVILVTPYDSIESLARRQFPFLPTTLLLRHRFRSIDYAPQISAPCLVIYGGRDMTVPPASTRKLLDHLDTSSKTVFIENAGHNTIETFAEYDEAVRSFLK